MKKRLAISLFTFTFSLFTFLCEAQYTDLLGFSYSTCSAPSGGLTVSLSGNTLYGMGQGGGANGDGCIFSIHTDGSGYKDLWDFNNNNSTNGYLPYYESLVLSGGVLYGVTAKGGINDSGSIFSIDTNGNEYKDLHDFTLESGWYPTGGLAIVGSNLYGMTQYGGANNGGNIFSIDTNGNGYKDMLDFNGYAEPRGTLTPSGSGVLYGMSTLSGSNGSGIVFSVDTDGTHYHYYYVFNGSPNLLNYANGNSLLLSGSVLYGTTEAGGANGHGYIFSIDTNGSGYTDRYDFDYATGGGIPVGTPILLGKTLYGMTYDGGAQNKGNLYSVDTNGNGYQDLLQFEEFTSPQGTYPSFSLTSSGSILYGMTAGWANFGNIFSYDTNNTLPLSVAANVISNVSCNGIDNGNANANASDGNTPYTYSWSNGSTTVSTSNPTGTILSAGTYTITITDATSETATATVTISQPNMLGNAAAVVSNVSCYNGSNGSVAANPNGGTTPYTYSWSGSLGTNATVNSLSAGTYTLTINDSCNSSSTASVTVTQPNALGASANFTPLTCGNTNGTATAIPSDGTSPYTYTWSSNSGSQTTMTATGLSAGGYSVTVTDACGGDLATAYVSVTQTPALTTGYTVNHNATECAHSGSITATPSGGTTPYTYSWNGGGTSTIATATGLAATTYTLTVTDATGCTATAIVTITAPANLLVGTHVITNTTECANFGSITEFVSGGTAPYTYAWNGGGTSTNGTASNLSAGTYTLTLTDANNCTASAPAIITAPPTLTDNAVATANTTECTNVGIITVTPGGGVSPYTYAWASLGDTSYSSSHTITGLSAGTYAVIVVDSNYCFATATVAITAPAALVVNPYSVDSTGGKSIAAATVSGGLNPYTYTWTGSLTTDTIKNLTAGTYTCTVQDANDCSETISVTIVPTGINKITGESEKVNVYPNPSNGIFTVAFSHAELVSASQTIEVYNVLGEKVYSQFNIQNPTFNINLSSQPGGVYLYRVIANSGELIGEGKVIIQK